MGGKTSGSFVKGDKRINRNGRPKDLASLRALAQQIAHEQLPENNLTVVEAILRRWAGSRDAKLSLAFIEYAFGKLPQPQEISGPNGGPMQTESNINIQEVNYRAGIANSEPTE